MSSSAGAGAWLEKALLDLCNDPKTGLALDADLINGLVSYCELASPQDAQEYLNNIVGQEAGQSVIEEYLRRRGYGTTGSSSTNAPKAEMQAYMKPPQQGGLVNGTKKQPRASKEVASSSNQANKISSEKTESGKGNSVSSKKKRGKVVSLAEAAKGTIVFQQGKPCSCQARQHKLVSNCLSCGKIICEQEGEGPCSFCGALVLKEGSTYAGLEETALPLSDAEAAAEAFAKRLVDYDRNSADRTTVIDDQSDYYNIEGNNWLSAEEKALLKKKQEEIEEEDRLRRSKVIVTFDLVGRKVVMNKDEASGSGAENSVLRPPDEREANRIKPNPTVMVQPVFVDLGKGTKNHAREKKQQANRPTNGLLCMEITGRVQHDGSESRLMEAGLSDVASDWRGPHSNDGSHTKEEYECSLDYN